VLQTLVLFTTRSGHSRGLAARLGKRLDAPVHEIVDLVSGKGIIGFLRAGAHASRKMATPITDPGLSLAGVKLVVIVQPVWASSVCPPVRSWLLAHRADLRGKRIALFVSSLGPSPARLPASYEAEFGPVFGPLAAFGGVRQTLGEPEREKIIEDFACALERAEASRV
jgi:hypothetical protein